MTPFLDLVPDNSSSFDHDTFSIALLSFSVFWSLLCELVSFLIFAFSAHGVKPDLPLNCRVAGQPLYAGQEAAATRPPAQPRPYPGHSYQGQALRPGARNTDQILLGKDSRKKLSFNLPLSQLTHLQSGVSPKWLREIGGLQPAPWPHPGPALDKKHG